MAAMQLTRTHRILIGVVVAGAVVIAGIGFAGSYAAVRALALQKGFGSFSLVFPIGIDMGICVLLALDLLLTWIRIPFPLLRQTAWLLTAATIAFNGAAAWPDPLGVGMHAVIPILFVVTVEAARHAVGRIADITADRHMEGVRITRWLLSPFPTFKLWRRMKLWELRSYEQAVGMEQDRLIYQARLQARYGRAWRRKAPVEALMPLRLARIGVPLAQTAPEGLAAAGIDPVLLPPAAPGTTALPEVQAAQVLADTPALTAATAQPQPPATPMASPTPAQAAAPVQGPPPQPGPAQPGPAQPEPAQPEPAQPEPAEAGPVFHGPAPFAVEPTAMPAAHNSAWFAAPLAPQAAYEGGYNPQYVEGLEPIPVMPPTGPEEQRRPEQQELPIPAPRSREAAASQAEAGTEAEADTDDAHVDEAKFAEAAYEVFRAYLDEFSQFPTPEQVDIHLSDRHGIVHPRSASMIRRLMPELKQRYQRDLENEHIA
ncbi:DUF2637 domain-containing protein [Streptomyces sp. NBC_00513]|uniref:DUF2637 domain-containing protein n=1 Tax=unclassified Streptomyces TaxID=2593676 RepID=UPI0022508FD9|nr:DUF2637 domain-containing protein [Streptomyces sp. NBC_00424]MCX5074855.1 DUF2637 domain-containing protein [Streptomyces sp. NBC_00424]WUD41978.1 DUF2637 domain-containing protein [Streptomyces sp. NBC_00513]